MRFPVGCFAPQPPAQTSLAVKTALAYDVGTFAVVISHRGWRPHLIRHELIHHLQNERLGWLRARLFKPEWWREGMAYSLSRDPRKSLPEPLQTYRSQFEAWFSQVGAAKLWAEAEQL